MKKVYKFFILSLAITGLMFQSCETIELEATDNPNSLTVDQIDPLLLYNSIQLNYLAAVTTFNNNGGQLARIDYLGDEDYFNYAGSSSLNGPWGNLYSGMNPDIEKLIELAAESDADLSFMVGASKIMKAHVMMLLVDYLGDIVHTEANQPIEFPNPMLDDDAFVYTQAIALLDEGIANITGGPDSNNPTSLYGLDLFFDNTAGNTQDRWIKVANTLKMRMNLTLGNYNEVLTATNVIDAPEDDFGFWYGTNVQLPDNRHPDYGANYTINGGGSWRSNWLMNQMVSQYGDLGGTGINDPRRRYYFYRQSAVTPGSYSVLFNVPDGGYYILNEDPNVERIECSGNAIFPHLAFTPEEDYWCSMRMGYWGRDHFNNEGAPPDEFYMTLPGVYPAGGLFDGHNDFSIRDDFDGDGEFEIQGYTNNATLGAGGGGAGMEPIILSSYVDFWRAEAALVVAPGSAAGYLQTAMQKSINKVMSFSSLDPGANAAEFPTTDDVDDFVEAIIDEFNAADETTAVDANGWPLAKDKRDILGEQFFIAMFGGAADAHNFVRRTGYPRTLARGWEPNRGPYPRTYLYPSSEASTNPNVAQRTDTQSLTFWDNGTVNTAN